VPTVEANDESGAYASLTELAATEKINQSYLCRVLKFLKGAKLDPQPVVGVSNRFLISLQKGEIENFGSHFRDAPYGDGSIGDERTRWEEFKAFSAQFACSKCGRTKFKRPNDFKKPVCAHDGCEAQFEFAAAATYVPLGMKVDTS
jgi:hypothetical protein